MCIRDRLSRACHRHYEHLDLLIVDFNNNVLKVVQEKVILYTAIVTVMSTYLIKQVMLEPTETDEMNTWWQTQRWQMNKKSV